MVGCSQEIHPTAVAVQAAEADGPSAVPGSMEAAVEVPPFRDA